MEKPRERYRIGLELLGPAKGLKILDAGCGFGTIEKYIDATGIDQSLYNLDQFRKTVTDSKAVRGRLETLPFSSNYFDAVLMLETLEHVRDEDASLTEIERVTKPGGKLILSVPANHLLYNIIDLEHWLIPILTGRPPHRHYKKTALKTTLDNHGFKIEHAFERGLIFSAATRWFIFLFDLFDRFFCGGFNGPLGRLIRKIFDPMIDMEFRIPTSYGHSIFVAAFKKR